MFSVVIPLYNKEQSVKNTIQSVLNQSFQDFEIVIINDGSTDKSVEIVEAFHDPRIRVIHQKNQGVSAARNKGIEEAKYEWIAFLDADDLWKENHLEEFKNIIEKFPNDKIFCTSYIRSDEKKIFQKNDSIEIIENYFQRSIKESFFWTSITCIHRSVFKEIGNFKVFLNRGEDLDLWDRIGRQYRFIRSKNVTAIYRIEAENRSVNRKFNIEKSTLYYYNINFFTKNDKDRYYKKSIRRTLRSFLARKDFVSFYKLILRYHFKILF